MRFLQATIDTTTMLADLPLVKKFCVVGSALIDPDTAKDLDFLVLVDDTSFLCGVHWKFPGDWTLCSGEYSDTDESWGTIRQGIVNLIVTVDPAWYERAVLANEVCVALKLRDKADRIAVYRVVRDGYNSEQANARRAGSR